MLFLPSSPACRVTPVKPSWVVATKRTNWCFLKVSKLSKTVNTGTISHTHAFNFVAQMPSVLSRCCGRRPPQIFTSESEPDTESTSLLKQGNKWQTTAKVVFIVLIPIVALMGMTSNTLISSDQVYRDSHHAQQAIRFSLQVIVSSV